MGAFTRTGLPRECDLIAHYRESVRFKDGNEVPYWMDFSGWRGLPSDRDFYIIPEDSFHEGYVTIYARGYGVKEAYGNGNVYIKEADLRANVVAASAPK